MKSCGKGTGKRKLSVISCSRFLRSASAVYLYYPLPNAFNIHFYFHWRLIILARMKKENKERKTGQNINSRK